ncbi:AMP-binding protein [Nocardia sp. NPDC127579]|uniref:AMP-binding protein n=1 Tax=Nocardia sp. NPDC127579 TaxID=3345402 RepID=UPI003639EECC
MVSEIVEVVEEYLIPRHALWRILIDPRIYPRLFAGIGACEQVSVAGDHPVFALRVGTPALGIDAVWAQLAVGRKYESFELRTQQPDCFVTVGLRGTGANTRVTVVFYAADPNHPLLRGLTKKSVTRWARAGLDRIADYAVWEPTAVVVNHRRTRLMQGIEIAGRVLGTGIVSSRPDRALRQSLRLVCQGFTPSGGFAVAAARSPDRLALVDHWGACSYAGIDRRARTLACALSRLGFGRRDTFGLLARNHIETVECLVAAGRLGADVVLLDAGLSPRRIAQIAARGGLSAVFVDGDLEALVSEVHPDVVVFSTDGASSVPGRVAVEDMIVAGRKRSRAPRRSGRIVVLTSGSGDSPKGAWRSRSKGFAAVAAIRSRIPFRTGETMLITVPLTHSWGLVALQAGVALRATIVLPDFADAEECLRQIAIQGVTVLVTAPAMLRALLDLPVEVLTRYDISSLRMVVSCGAPLAGATVLRFLGVFGDILYNVYGSTEASVVSVADPVDLRISPETVGKPPRGTTVAALGPDRQPVPIGAVGRIFVRNHWLFDGYVDAVPPDDCDGLLDTGDLGYLDVSGRLFLLGRADETIRARGGTVFARPIEEALEMLPQVREAAVLGIPDDDLGQRLTAFVVCGGGLDPEAIRHYLRHRLGRRFVPHEVNFLNALPRSGTGTVLKRLLAASIS